MNVVETEGLCHRYAKGRPALEDVGLEVPAGSIYGFLGPNGAGKTTTLRLLLGLIRKQRGSIRLFGRDLGRDRRAILAKTGSLIETPSVYSHLSATENLRIWQILYRSPARRIGEVLALVGLEGTGTKPAGRFSLGMKQRLGLAVALMHEPSLLLLDEPTNGLDPAGILEIRTLLEQLHRSAGVTIVVSSHLLSEIERLVTHVGVLHNGRLLFQGPFAELAGRRIESTVNLATDDNGRAVQLLTEAGWPARLTETGLSAPGADPSTMARMNACLVHAGIAVHGVQASRPDLEAIFLDLVGDSNAR